MAYNNNYNQGNNKGGRYQQGYNKGGRNQQQSFNNKQPIEKDFYNPYTFVPFSKKVYELTEDEKAELEMVHDVPVKGSLSGKIRVDFEAVTPFCVRKSDGKNMSINEKYYVPGTSIKGMVRSVFEILTYSNARNGVANNRYSMRDLNSKDYELKNQEQESGFLVKVKGKYYIQRCKSKKMNYDDIKKVTGEDISDGVRTIRDKYKRIPRFIKYEGKEAIWFFSESVPTRPHDKHRKKHEFLFYVPNFSEEKLIPIKKEELEDFLFIHEKENENKNWKYWRGLISNYPSVKDVRKEGIVPCFFRTFNDGSSVKDLGFSYLYRQPYSKKLHEFLPEAHQKANSIDMAQAVFGYVNGKDSLKGRVQFGNSFIEKAHSLQELNLVLGSPKPTFYPFYLEQNNGYGQKQNTYFSNSTLSGTKRFLLRNVAEKGTTKSNVSTNFTPLDKGTKFTSYIYFFNLHDYELGALLAAITFCNQLDCHHSLGYAKPFGYGRLKVNSCTVEQCELNDIDVLIQTFINKLTSRCQIDKKEWSDSVHKLFAIAKGGNYDKPIHYPNMQNKDFQSIKSNKYSLNDFTPDI